MVAAGVPTPDEAAWLGSLRTRNLAIAEARRFGGKQAGDSLEKFAHQVVELAFARDRVDRGSGDPRIIGLLHEETYALYAARGASPALHSAPFISAPPHQCAAASQLRPYPTLTSSGTSRAYALPILSRTSFSSVSRSPSATSNSNSSCTCSSIRDERPASLIA